ncbi:CDP-diacylglycerol--glycerol-3-phosphate 3-phosphatidyltransferase [Candidatus Saccharibacteria bacterium]|nr:CDP-diacylglycerol--glycerol-3-phosphate 3-phosphatidyltransferase [Candidatus Saccharibacteria bacterium]
MNLPNKLTMLRILLVPVFVFLLLCPIFGEGNKWVVLAIFCVACFTDFLDGKIARKYHMITDFGKFMDPLADKLLVCSALICLIDLNLLPSWFVVIVIAREFVVSGLRLIAVDNGIVIAASWWGKFKTAFQMALIILLILNFDSLKVITTIIFWVTLALTLVSMLDYLWKNRSVVSQTK